MAMETRDVLVSRRTRSRSTGHAESWGDAVAVSAAACNVSWTAESSTSASAAAIPQAAAVAATGGCAADGLRAVCGALAMCPPVRSRSQFGIRNAETRQWGRITQRDGASS